MSRQSNTNLHVPISTPGEVTIPIASLHIDQPTPSYRPSRTTLRVAQQYDVELSRTLYVRGQAYMPRQITVMLEHAGNGIFHFIVSIVGLLIPLSALYRQFFANLLAGYVLDILLVAMFKVIVRRQRPRYSNNTEYAAIHPIDGFSFPSGHTSRIMFIAYYCTVLCNQQCTWAWWLAVSFVWVWAACTALSRVILGRHYVSDVICGTILAVGTLLALTQGTMSTRGLLVQKDAILAVTNKIG